MATDGPAGPEGGSPGSRRNPLAEPVSIAAAPRPRALLTPFPRLRASRPWLAAPRALGRPELSVGKGAEPPAQDFSLLDRSPRSSGELVPPVGFQAVDVTKSQAPRSCSQCQSRTGSGRGPRLQGTAKRNWARVSGSLARTGVLSKGWRWGSLSSRMHAASRRRGLLIAKV